jgi:hypothetical protein
MTEVDEYIGRMRRRCPNCGVEIEVIRPTRVMAKTSNPSWRRAFRKEVQSQVLWEGLCDECRRWWNQLLRRVERPGGDPEP